MILSITYKPSWGNVKTAVSLIRAGMHLLLGREVEICHEMTSSELTGAIAKDLHKQRNNE